MCCIGLNSLVPSSEHILRTLRSHGMYGMPPPALHAVFQSTAMAKVTYAAPAWWGFTNSADRNRLEAFVRRAVRHGYCADTTPTFSSLCDKADLALFDNIITSSRPTHPLHTLPPPKVEKLLYPSPRPLLSTST